MQALGGMGADGYSLDSTFTHELEHPALNVFPVGGALDVFAKLVFELLQGFGRVGQEQKAAPVVVGHYGVNVDANQNADVRDIAEKGADGEIAGGAQEAYQGVKPFDVCIA